MTCNNIFLKTDFVLVIILVRCLHSIEKKANVDVNKDSEMKCSVCLDGSLSNWMHIHSASGNDGGFLVSLFVFFLNTNIEQQTTSILRSVLSLLVVL